MVHRFYIFIPLSLKGSFFLNTREKHELRSTFGEQGSQPHVNMKLTLGVPSTPGLHDPRVLMI